MSECISAEDWTEADEATRRHLATCAECAALSDDLERIRGLARDLAASGWAGAAPPHVDVEAALATVLRGGVAPAPRRRASAVLQLASSMAAAAVLFSTVAPSMLRWRIDSQPTGQERQQLSGTSEQIFWTTAGGR